MSLKQIPCHQENHHQMPFQYVCLHANCLKNSKFLLCIYCCEQSHKNHVNNVKSLKVLLKEIQRNKIQTQFGGTDILLNGIYNCSFEEDLKHNVYELVQFLGGSTKFQKLVSKQNIDQKNNIQTFYQKRGETEKLEKTLKKNLRIPSKLCSDTNFISPVLTFSQEDAFNQQFEFLSPFCISNVTQKMVTALAYPPLNRFNESIESVIKIQKLTPFWLGIGVSKGKSIFQNGSKNHIILTSNGWISVWGQLKRTNVKYCTKDKIKIKWDKSKSLIEFTSNTQRQIVKFDLKWDQDVYLCTILYYKQDCVQIIS